MGFSVERILSQFETVSKQIVPKESALVSDSLRTSGQAVGFSSAASYANIVTTAENKEAFAEDSEKS